MDARLIAHPSTDTLEAFGLGKLDDAAAEAVLSHLEGCPHCRQRVQAQPDDSFVERLRQAHRPGTTPAPEKTLSGVSFGLEASGPPPILALPPELAANAQYEIVRELGRGGMGVVYLARHRLSGRQEVLKVMNKELLARPGSKERFQREIQSAARLDDHENVVKMYTAAELDGLMVLVMQYVEGQDLATLVKDHGRLPVPHACYYAQQVAKGLQYAFEKGMVHRDIKPNNLILSREGKKHLVKILDFGLAKATSEQSEDRELTGQGKMLGTPHYVAPEQILDATNADIRADIYSLGCTLYYLLTGTPPFNGNSLYEVLHAHQTAEARPLNLERPEVPVELAAVVAKMMAKDPARRYQRPAEAAQALSPFIKPGAKGAPVTSSPELSQAAAPPRPPSAVAAKVKPTSAPAAEVAEGVLVSARAAAREPTPVDRETLTTGSDKHPRSRDSGVTHPRRSSAAEPAARKLWPIWIGVPVCMLLIGLVALWAGGVFKVKTKDGVIVLENLPADAEVLVDGERMTVTWAGGGKTAEITVKPGTRKVVATKDGVKVIGEEVVIEEGGQKVVTARLEPLAKVAPPAQPTANQPADGFVPLFNGKDLTGWKTHPKQPGNWRVENSVLIGSGPRANGLTSHLYSERDNYKDFHLRAEARINDGGNSGVCFRTPFGPQSPANHPRWLLGYEAQINSTHGGPNKTGSLYVGGGECVVSHRDSPVPPGEWFTLEVIAEGSHVVVKVNGKATADYTDEKRRLSGHIALQQHNPQTVAEFRKIEIRELPAADRLPTGTSGRESGHIAKELTPGSP